MIVAVVAKRMDEARSAAVAQRRTRPGTVKAEEKEETEYVIVTKAIQYEPVVKEDEARYMIWAKEEEKIDVNKSA